MDDRRDRGRGGERGPRSEEGRARDGDNDGDRGPGGGGRGGAPNTEFLDLEITKVLYGEASGLVRAAARELLQEAIKARLRERLGDRLDAIARLAADELVLDVEANLEIEARIVARQEARASIDERVREAFAGKAAPARSGGRRR